MRGGGRGTTTYLLWAWSWSKGRENRGEGDGKRICLLGAALLLVSLGIRISLRECKAMGWGVGDGCNLLLGLSSSGLESAAGMNYTAD
jgi:hypothetical protein